MNIIDNNLNSLRSALTERIKNYSEECPGFKLLDTESFTENSAHFEVSDFAGKTINQSVITLKEVYLSYSAIGRGVAFYSKEMQPLDLSTMIIVDPDIEEFSNAENMHNGFFAADRFTGGNMCHVFFDHVCRGFYALNEKFLPSEIYFLSTSWGWAKKMGDLIIGDFRTLEPLKLYFFESLTLFPNAFEYNLNHPNFCFHSNFIERTKKVTKILGKKDASLNLFINRKSAKVRKFPYEEALERYFLDRGFKSVDLSELDFIDQVSLFSQAKLVVSEHGAGLSNIIACPDNASIIEIFHSGGTAAYERIAKSLGLRYTRLDITAEHGEVQLINQLAGLVEIV